MEKVQKQDKSNFFLKIVKNLAFEETNQHLNCFSWKKTLLSKTEKIPGVLVLRAVRQPPRAVLHAQMAARQPHAGLAFFYFRKNSSRLKTLFEKTTSVFRRNIFFKN